MKDYTRPYHSSVLKDEAGIGSWCRHTASWYARRHLPNVLVLTYAELYADRGAGVDRVAAHLGVELDPEARARVIERTGMAWMKAHRDRFAAPVARFRGAGMSMLRKGGSGDGGSLVSQEHLAELDRRFAERLGALGSDFPYPAGFSADPPVADGGSE